MTTMTVTIDVELDEFDDDEIAEEYAARNLGICGLPEQREAMFLAMQVGDEAKALSLLRQYLCDSLGRVL